MKNLNAILSVLVLSVISTACGNIQSGQLNSANYNSSASGSELALSGAASCAANPNISGQGYNSSLQNQYRACNNGQVGGITLYPEDDSTKEICVFPAKVSGTQVAIFAQIAKCTTIRASGTTLSFTGLSFNAAYVVDKNAVSQFYTCVTQNPYGSLSACASQMGIGAYYGYGQF